MFNSVLDSDDALLWHKQLGHPSFNYLKKLIPSLNFSNISEQCDICQLAKHTCTNLQPRSYKPTSPFSIIHSDLWGPPKSQHQMDIGGLSLLLMITPV